MGGCSDPSFETDRWASLGQAASTGPGWRVKLELAFTPEPGRGYIFASSGQAVTVNTGKQTLFSIRIYASTESR
uniref:Uncharacterized protein n=1 Tax=Arundo donax TaxID=35708 RepID=A0A0A9A6F9_ARUDO